MIIRQISSITELRSAFDFVNKNLDINQNHPRNIKYYAEQFKKHPELLLLAEKKGTIKGILLASVEDDHVLVGELVVALNFRGKGIGSGLIIQLEENARIIGQHKILLGAQKEAESFYLKHRYLPKLFIQVNGKNHKDRLHNFLSKLTNRYHVSWINNENEFSKVIIETGIVDSDFQNKIQQSLENSRTQYLFSKEI